MNGFLRISCKQIRSGMRLQPNVRPLALERVCERLDKQEAAQRSQQEPWEDFLHRIDFANLATLRLKDYQRLLHDIWLDTAHSKNAGIVLQECAARPYQSVQRTLILAYLRHYPMQHPQFKKLAEECHSAAIDSPWHTRGEQWQLWRVSGPTRVADALLGSDLNPKQMLADIGLDGNMADCGFVQAVLAKACHTAMKAKGEQAQQNGTRLRALFANVAAAEHLEGELTYCLLKPWLNHNPPSDEYRRILSEFLVKRHGDPRLHQARWASVRRDVLNALPNAEVVEAFAVLRRWLVQASVYAFFKIVGQTVENKEHWRAREKFWTAYLEADLVQDAWFAFGPHALNRARSLPKEDSLAYGAVNVTGQQASHSVLILSIGRARIAEWSHDGACRFWMENDANAAKPYMKRYEGTQLRAMKGNHGFNRMPHSGVWQPKFTKQIYGMTGISHPTYKRGY